MKIKLLVASLCLSATASACGLHQNTGFNIVSEEGSLAVFGEIVEARQSGDYLIGNKPDHFRLFSFKRSLSAPHEHKQDFVIFEAIKGHYSDVRFGDNVLVSGKDVLPTSDEVMIVTELDVLDALSSGKLDWGSAKEMGLIRINAPSSKTKAIDDWFSDMYKNTSE